jgi:very-short-patch-repair endonuclease
MTDTEQALWRELRRNSFGWRFRRQFPIPPFIVDFACVEARLIIETDGGLHARPGDHDRRDAALRLKGWRVLRFWNNDVLLNRAGVLQTIAETLGTWPSTYPHPDPPPQAGEGVRSEHSSRSSLHNSGASRGRPLGESPPPLAGEG